MVFDTKSEIAKKVRKPRLRREERVWLDIRIFDVRIRRNVMWNKEE
jgi:hypothetical protein